jgi:hypothetical protein
MKWTAETAELHYKISNYDMDILANHLPTNMDGNTVIKFRVYVRIPGSDQEGATAQLYDLQYHDFDLILVDSSVVEQCGQNQPEFVNDYVRDDFNYNIQTAAQLNVEDQAVLTIDAKQV